MAPGSVLMVLIRRKTGSSERALTYTRRWTPRDQGIYHLLEVNFWCKFQFGSGQSRWVMGV